MNFGPSGVVIIPGRVGAVLSSPMLAPPSFRSFLSPVVLGGRRQGGRSGCGHAWNCSRRSGDRRLDDVSIRELADRHGVHRRTVRQAFDDAVPPPRKAYPARPRPAIEGWVAVIDAWLIADEDAPRKQRHTARRIWQRLVAEHQATLSEVTVSRYVARRRVELGPLTHQVSIPQTHLAGAEAEVDFGEFYSTIAGLVVKCWMF